MAAAVQLAAEDDPGAHAGPDGQEDEVVDAARNTLPLLAEGRQVDVVLERHRQAERLFELGAEGAAFQSRHVLGQVHDAAVRIGHARDADDDAVDELRVELRRREQRRAQPLAGLDRLGGVGDLQLDVLPRADDAVQIAERAAHEAGAEVEAQHERRLRHRLEVNRAVAGSVGATLGLAHEPAIDERLQRQGDGRLRDPRPPRDLRARDRRAGADRLEHLSLVDLLQQPGNGSCLHRQQS